MESINIITIKDNNFEINNVWLRNDIEASIFMPILRKISEFQVKRGISQYSLSYPTKAKTSKMITQHFVLKDQFSSNANVSLVCTGSDKYDTIAVANFISEIFQMVMDADDILSMLDKSNWSSRIQDFLDRLQLESFLLEKFLPILGHIPRSDDSVIFADSLVQRMEAPDARDSLLFEEYSIFNSEGGAVWFNGRLIINHLQDNVLVPIYQYLLFSGSLEPPFREDKSSFEAVIGVGPHRTRLLLHGLSQGALTVIHVINYENRMTTPFQWTCLRQCQQGIYVNCSTKWASQMNFYRSIVTAPEDFCKLGRQNTCQLFLSPSSNRSKTEQEKLNSLMPSTEIPNTSDGNSNGRTKQLVLFPFENLLTYKFYDPRVPGYKMPLTPNLPVTSDLYYRIIRCFNAFSRTCVREEKERGMKAAFLSVRFLEKVARKSKGVVLDGTLDIWFAFKKVPYGDGWISAAYVGDNLIDLENLLIKL